MAALIKTIGGVKVYQEDKALLYVAGMQVDADGDEMAYGPDGVPGIKPLDYLANAGQPGNWWGVTTDSDGKPYVQEQYHLAPGYYVSSTSLCDTRFPPSNPQRFMDSSQIPFFVLPSDFASGLPSSAGVPKVGDLGFAFNTQTQDNNCMIYADVGPQSQIGEGSMALARTLGLSPNPKNGGTESQIICYWFVPGSGKGWQPVDSWWQQALGLFNTWGGLKRLNSVLAEIS